VRHIVIIRDECESQRISRLKLEQHIARMRDAKSVLRRLHENPDEAEFRNRTSLTMLTLSSPFFIFFSPF